MGKDIRTRSGRRLWRTFAIAGRVAPMKRPLWLIVAIALSCTSAGSASAQQGADDGFTIIRPSGADRKTCNARVATRVALPTLITDAAQWHHKCIKVDGYWSGQMLFASTTVINAETRLDDHAHVGMYFRSASRSGPRQPRLYTAVGVLGRCDALPTNVMVFGYCHYWDGPYLAVADMIRR